MTHAIGPRRFASRAWKPSQQLPFLGVLLLAGGAHAQAAASSPSSKQPRAEPTATARSTSIEPEKAETEPLSKEELAEIQNALGSDATSSPAPPASAPAPAGTTSLGVAAFLPDIGLVLDVAAAYFSSDEPLQQGAHDPTENGFNLQQLEVSLSKNVDPYFRLQSSIVLSLEEVELEEAFATTLSLPYNLQARVGLMLTRFGRHNPMHVHQWEFVDQPFVLSKFFGGEGNRGLGVELSVLAPLPWYVELVGSTTDARGEATARSFMGSEDSSVESPLDLQNTLALKQFFELSHNWSLLWGLSLANGPNANGPDTRSDIYGSDVYLKYRPISHGGHTTISLQTEWLYRRRQLAGALLQDFGSYSQLLWRFEQRWSTAFRYEYGSAPRDLQGAALEDPLDPEQEGQRQRAALNLSFYPTEFSRLRLQGSSDFPSWRRRADTAVFLAVEVVAGTHAAHKF